MTRPRRRADRASGGQDARRALERGRLVHRLMQSLPDLPASERAAAAQRYLDRAGAAFEGDERDRLVAGVLGLLADDRFAPLFAPGSRAEVPIVGRLHRPGRPDILVSGQIDRLVVTADAVLIADYKTNQVVPRYPADGARRPTSRSSRSTGPCSARSTPAGPCEPPWCGPRAPH